MFLFKFAVVITAFVAVWALGWGIAYTVGTIALIVEKIIWLHDKTL